MSADKNDENDTRSTAMLIFRDEGVDGAQLAADGRSKELFKTRAVTLRVDRCDANGIVMTCIGHQNNPDWVGTTLAIELSETPTGTRVHLIQSGYPAKNEVYERCVGAWQYFLNSLTSYIMTGVGEPYPTAA
jgi:hypothetical protein